MEFQITDIFNSHLVNALVLAGAIYGGIRADMKYIHETLARHEKSLQRAHDRLTDYITGKNHG
jgi:hypothetical protein